MVTLLERQRSQEATAAQRQADALAEAEALYPQLLHRNAEPQPGDDEALAECLRLLGKSTGDFQADLQKIARMQQLRSYELTDEQVTELEAARQATVDASRAELVAVAAAIVEASDIESAGEILRRAVFNSEWLRPASNKLIARVEGALFNFRNAENGKKNAIAGEYDRQRQIETLRRDNPHIFP